MLNVNLKGIPATLKEDRRWVVYKTEDLLEGKKVPYSVKGYKASSNNPDSWATFGEVEALLSNNSEYAAVGYSLKDSGICVVDIDNHPKSIDTSKMTDTEIDEINLYNRNLESAVRVFTNLISKNIDTYIEKSISDRGTHVFIKGELLEGYETSAKKVPLEIYTSNDHRFIVMTGVRVTDFDITDKVKDIDFIKNLQKNNFLEKSNNAENTGLKIEPIKTLAYDDDYVVRVALKDTKFSLLWNDSWEDIVDSEGSQRYSSQHYADAALIQKLVFYTKNCPEQVKRLFKASPTYKAYGVGDKAGKYKFESDIDNDLKSASNNCFSVYDPKAYYERLKVENPEEYETRVNEIQDSSIEEDLLTEGDLDMLKDFENAIEENEVSYWTPDFKEIREKLEGLKHSALFKTAMYSYMEEYKEETDTLEYIDGLHEIDKNVLGYAKLVKRVLGDSFMYSPKRSAFFKYNGIKYEQLEIEVLPGLVINALKEAKHSIFKYSVQVLDVLYDELNGDSGLDKYNEDENSPINSDSILEETRVKITELTHRIAELRKEEKQDYKELAKVDKELEKARKYFDKITKEVDKLNKEASNEKASLETNFLLNATELWTWITSNKLISVRNAEDVLKVLKFETTVEDDIVDYNDCPYINFLNGVLNLDTGEFLDHSSEYKIDKVFNCNYDIEAKSPTFDAALAKFQPDEAQRKELIKYFGLSLAKGHETLKKILVLLFGGTDTGKTTIEGAVAHVFGDYATTIDPTLLMKSYTSKSNVGPELLALRDSLMISISETEENDKLDTAKIKALTGNTTLTTRNLYDKKMTSFQMKGVIHIDTNFRPSIPSVDEAMWNRLRIIPFDTKIAQADKDPEIFKKLESEADGIFNRVLEGYRLLMEEGLTETQSMIDAKFEYRDEMSTVKAFIKECVMVYTDATDTAFKGCKIRTTQMFETYSNWCEDNSQNVMKRTRFFTEIDSYLQKFKTGGYEYFKACGFNALGILYSKMKEQSKQDFNLAKNQLMLKVEQDAKANADMPTYNSMKRIILVRTAKWYVDNLSDNGNLNVTFAKGLYLNYVSNCLENLQLPLKQQDYDKVVDWLYANLGNVQPIQFNEAFLTDKISEMFSSQIVISALDNEEVNNVEFGGKSIIA